MIKSKIVFNFDSFLLEESIDETINELKNKHKKFKLISVSVSSRIIGELGVHEKNIITIMYDDYAEAK